MEVELQVTRIQLSRDKPSVTAECYRFVLIKDKLECARGLVAVVWFAAGFLVRFQLCQEHRDSRVR